MVENLQPIDFIFKSDYLLCFDASKATFYRCFVVAGVGDGCVSVLLIDEYEKRKVGIHSLYKMPTRFYRYHNMCFGLVFEKSFDAEKVCKSLNQPFLFQNPSICDIFQKVSERDHHVSVTIKRVDKTESSVNIYFGSLGKITTLN